MDKITVKGIIFDMDGVLIDSEPYMAQSSALALNRRGMPAKAEDFEQFCGMGEYRYLGGVAALYGGSYSEELKDEAYSIYIEGVEDNCIVFPKVRETVLYLAGTGIPMAVASSADSVKVLANVRALKLPEDIFTRVITGSDVSRNKPDPDILLKAAKALGVDPEKCLVAEDSIAGVKAAKAAGSFCLGITTSHTEEELKEAGADMTSPDIGILKKIIC